MAKIDSQLRKRVLSLPGNQEIYDSILMTNGKEAALKWMYYMALGLSPSKYSKEDLDSMAKSSLDQI